MANPNFKRPCRPVKKDDLAYQLASSFSSYKDTFASSGPVPSDGLPSDLDTQSDGGDVSPEAMAALPVLTPPDCMINGLMVTALPGINPAPTPYFANARRVDGLTTKASHIRAVDMIIEQSLVPIANPGVVVPGLPLAFGSIIAPNNSIVATTVFTTGASNDVKGDTLVLTAANLITQATSIPGSPAFGFSSTLPDGSQTIWKDQNSADPAAIPFDLVPYKDYSYFFNIMGFSAGAANLQALLFAAAPLFLLTVRNGNARPLSRFLSVQFSFICVWHDALVIPHTNYFNSGFTCMLNNQVEECTFLVQDLSSSSKVGSIYKPSFSTSLEMTSTPVANSTVYLSVALEVSGASNPTVTIQPLAQSSNFVQSYAACLKSKCTN